MTKKKRLFLREMIIFLCVVFIFSCNTDPENEDGKLVNDLDITGIYVFYVENDTRELTWVFTSNKKYNIYNFPSVLKRSGSWTISGNELLTDINSFNPSDKFSITENEKGIVLTYIGDSSQSSLFLSLSVLDNTLTLIKTNEIDSEILNPDFSYYKGLSTVTITGYNGNEIDLIIPADIGGKSVAYIANDAFYYNGLNSVVIPNSVISIGNNAFRRSQLMGGVTLGNNVISIGNTAFMNNDMINITIPDNVLSIGASAFQSNKLTSVMIGNGLTVIEGGVFCRNQIDTVTIGNNVRVIKDSAFETNKISSIIFPDSVTSIGWHAFDSNPLTSITIGADVALQSGSFNNGFENTYYDGGCIAGTYKRPNISSTVWTKQ